MITSSEQCGSQHSSQSSDSGEPLSSGEEWQLALSLKTRVPTEHISSSSCIRKMYEREKYVVTLEGKTGSPPALTLKDFILPPIDDKLMEEDDSGYFWSLSVPSSSRSRTRSFHVLNISDDDIVSLHEEEFECDEPVFTIPEGGCYMDSGDESEGTPQPLLVEATQAMTLEPNESPDEFDSVQEIQLRSGKSPVIPASVVQGPRQPPAQGPIRPLVQGPSQVCIEADLSAADYGRSPFHFAVGHDVPPSRGRGWRGRGRSRDSNCPARNLYSRVPPPNLHSFPLTVESDSDDEMIDIVHHPAPSQSLSFADYNAFPTVRRHLIPEGGLVIDGGLDDDTDVGRQDTSRQTFPHPRYGMRVEGSSRQPSPVPPTTSVRGPLYSDSPSVHELHTLYVPPRPGWHASLFHSVGVPQSTDILGFVESTVDDEITLAPQLSSPFVDSCVERGLVPTTWTDGQARQQARVWRIDLPQTTRVLLSVAIPTRSRSQYGVSPLSPQLVWGVTTVVALPLTFPTGSPSASMGVPTVFSLGVGWIFLTVFSKIDRNQLQDSINSNSTTTKVSGSSSQIEDRLYLGIFLPLYLIIAIKLLFSSFPRSWVDISHCFSKIDRNQLQDSINSNSTTTKVSGYNPPFPSIPMVIFMSYTKTVMGWMPPICHEGNDLWTARVPLVDYFLHSKGIAEAYAASHGESASPRLQGYVEIAELAKQVEQSVYIDYSAIDAHVLTELQSRHHRRGQEIHQPVRKPMFDAPGSHKHAVDPPKQLMYVGSADYVTHYSTMEGGSSMKWGKGTSASAQESATR
ncbi:hypothetical protein M5K25_008183 [Dendrobium thyrsiflorum]|uniref:Uncharacterized protein n=1 Tax=Dendrobium thyrsiflorum TaxID=117978 RepID=A0ABD0V7C3_DENTH